MTIEYRYNAVKRTEPKGKKVPPLRLTFGRDPRPRCSLIVGDGFSQSFLAAQNLRDEIRWSIDNHFPPPGSVRYFPVIEDQFQLSPIWERQKWPRLYDLWENIGRPQGRDFYLSLPKDIVNPSRPLEKLTYNTASLAFELRCYLWHLFRSHHYTLVSPPCGEKIRFDKWEWMLPFMLFISEFALGVVSFNYDLLVELFLMNAFGWIVCHYDLRSEGEYNQRPADSVAMYKLHGSISYYLDTGMRMFTGKVPNPWLENSSFGMNDVPNPILNLNLEMKEFPEFPDLVPPGHYGDDKIAPVSRSKALSKVHIGQSRLVVFCGLSAEEPDTAEVKELVDAIDPAATLIQVGLDRDRDNVLSRLLRDKGLCPKFLLPTELRSIFQIVSADHKLHSDWSQLFT